MKKLIAAMLSLVIVATIALPAAAQERDRNYANQGSSRKFDDQRNRDRRSDGDYRDRDDNQGQRAYYNYKGDDGRSFWQNNHRVRDHRY